jgi:hypothetical protein
MHCTGRPLVLRLNGTSAGVYLFTIAGNIIIDERRSERFRKRGEVAGRSGFNRAC